MGEGDLKELRELVEFLKASGVAEFDMERPELKVRLKFGGVESSGALAPGGVDLAQLSRLLHGGVGAMPPPVVGSLEPPLAPAAILAAEVEADEHASLHLVKSPLVGTFYDASSPGTESFVKVGDTVALGKVLCIVEAMKIMNEIESDAAGEIVNVYVKPGQPVEYGQKLFAVKVS